MRFLRYVKKQEYVKNICDCIAPVNTIMVVGFGDWSGGSQSPISRKHCGPIEDIKRELRKRANVLMRMIDEYNTSKKDCLTHQPLKNMRALTTIVRRSANCEITRKTYNNKVHKVLHCQNNEGERPARVQTTWNRDVNASRNILMLLQLEVSGQPRPLAFSRFKQTTIH